MRATTTEHRQRLADLWLHFAEHEAGTYSPLYAAIARGVAADDDLLALVEDAPPHAHLPISLLAAAHFVLLGGADHPLAGVYAGERTTEPVAPFRDLCLSHREELLDVMARRQIQTNECGRSAVIALALSEVETRVGTPEVLVDAGASAGLNLLYDRYHLDYGSLGSLGDAASAVRVPCEVRGREQLPDGVPDIARRVGIDRTPVDVTDPEDVRWQLACVWPDTGRLDRTAAALAIAATAPPEVRAGDMVDALVPTIESMAGDGLVCVVTSWAYAYLRRRDRARFVEAVRQAAAARPVVWLSLEGAGVVDLFEPPEPSGPWAIAPSVVGFVTFGRAGSHADALALTHPHGSAFAWR